MVDISEALMKHHQSLPGGLRNPPFVVKDYMLPEEEWKKPSSTTNIVVRQGS
jgi:hypothetical protein